MKKIIISMALLATASMSFAQSTDMSRTNDWRLRWNMGQFANIGRYALQFGIERDIADNKTLSAEIGLSSFKGTGTNINQRYNYQGVQGLIEYRNYYKGFSHSKIRPFIALGLFVRELAFDADVTLGYGVSNPRDFNLSSHFESTTARYKTSTQRLHGAFGFRMPISPLMYFETSAGPAYGHYNVSHNIERAQTFVVDNFDNPFFMSSQKGSYFSPALYGSFSFGFVISKSNKHAGTAP